MAEEQTLIRGAHRITVVPMRGGQPRPYTDTETVVQVSFEQVPWLGKNEDLTWVAWWITEADAREILPSLKCGYINRPRGGNWYDSYLDYLKPRAPTTQKNLVTKEEEIRSWLWEFRVVTPFTD